MKTNLTFQSPFLVFLMAVLIFTAPFTTLAQQDSVEVQAKMAAKRDAETDTNKWLWTGVGCGTYVSTGLGIFIGLVAGSLGPQTASGSSYISDSQACGICIGATAGCLIPFIVAFNYKLEPPPERLLGKSPEYVDAYTSAYKTKVRRLRTKRAAVGTVIWMGSVGTVSVIAMMSES